MITINGTQYGTVKDVAAVFGCTPNTDLQIYALRESLDRDELPIAVHVLEELIAGLDEMKLEARRALVALHKMEQRGGEK